MFKPLIAAISGLLLAVAHPAAAQSFNFISQRREVFVDNRPSNGPGERIFREATGYDFFNESIQGEWQIPDPFARALSEATQSSTLDTQIISCAGFAFSLVTGPGVRASSASVLEARWTFTEPTPVVISAIAGGASMISLTGPGVDVHLSDGELFTTLDLSPGEYLLYADAAMDVTEPGELVGSFHIALGVVPSPGPLAALGIAACVVRRRGRTVEA
ncbi:MAG TPA: hypothetical protein VG797_02820 [Phycisphaerales bacterium]|nr:hypothetical protein [Phycisphaerales bacterium]